MTTYTDDLTKMKIQVSPAPYLGPGPTVRGKEIVIGYVSDSAEPVTLVLYEKGTKRVLAQIPMLVQEELGSVRSISLKGIRPSSVEYMFYQGDVPVLDPAARLLTGRSLYGEKRDPANEICRCALPKGEFDWKDERGPLRLPYEDVIAYCLHVRGFTRSRSAKVRHPGTFKGLEEKIPYLTDLGVNQVILMPAYEFDELGSREERESVYADPSSRPKLNFWGYGPGQYFAPKASYAAGKAPDIEFKGLVRAMHLAGIEVIMEFAFTDEVEADFMVQCLSWWIREYHVDGFVLLTSQQRAQALSCSPLLRRTKLMTGWFDSSAVYPKGRKIGSRVIADINDGFKLDARRLLKGDEGALRSFAGRMKANERDKAVINYIVNHDGFTLNDLVSYNDKHNQANGEDGRDGSDCEYSWNCGAEGPTKKKTINRLRMQQMKNAIAMLLCAQGTPMIMAGDEFGNSQDGNNNPWCLDNETSWVDWRGLKSQPQLHAFVREMIALRKAHPCLHRDGPLTGMTGSAGGFPDFSCHSDRAWYVSYEQDSRHIGILLSGSSPEGEADYLYIAYNFHWEEQDFALPYLPAGLSWKCRIDTGTDIGDDLDNEVRWPVRAFSVPGRTTRILEASAEALTGRSEDIEEVND